MSRTHSIQTHPFGLRQICLQKGRDHLNGIEGFWAYAEHWLYHYRGVPTKNFHLYLKEIEWRFNHRSENLVTLLRKLSSQRVVKEQNLVQL